jgi:hypothetical protein
MMKKPSLPRANARNRRAIRRGPQPGRQNNRNPAQNPLQHAIDRHFVHVMETEPVDPIAVPSTSQRGTLLYAVEINPRKLGRILAAAATQAQSWAGNFTFKMRVNGSVNATNYALARFLPDADLSKLPNNADELWRYVRATTSGKPSKNMDRALDRAFVKYNIISDESTTVSANWEQSYNPIKPMTDTDPSEENLGVFVIVSNGPPSEDITIDLDVKEDVYLCGPAPRTVQYDNSVFVSAVPNSNGVLGSNFTQIGNGSVDHTNNSYTITQPGRYLITQRFVGTGISSSPAVTTSPNAPFAFFWEARESTTIVQSYVVEFTEGVAVITIGTISATSLASTNIRIANFSA